MDFISIVSPLFVAFSAGWLLRGGVNELRLNRAFTKGRVDGIYEAAVSQKIVDFNRKRVAR